MDTWRLTSQDQHLIIAAAELWGGTVKPWEENKYEVVTDAPAIPVRVPPQQPDPEFQLWSRAGLQRRCDGQTCWVANGEGMIEQPCLCGPDDRECKPHTRFSFILPDIPDLGVWTLTSTGWNAATELTTSVTMLAGSQADASLGIEHRESRRPGQPVKKFVVPVLRLPVSMRSILEGGGVSSIPQLVAVESSPALPPSNSVDDAPPAPDPEVGEDATVDEPGGGVVHVLRPDESFESIRARATEQAWVSLYAELDDAPDGTMDENEMALRSLFRRMDGVGLWPDADKSLHAALKKHHGAAHVGDLRAAELRKFCETTWAAARDAVAAVDD